MESDDSVRLFGRLVDDDAEVFTVPPKTARECLALEQAALSFKEFCLQDANTLEATQTMLEPRVIDQFPLCDQEVLCHHLHTVTAERVYEYVQREEAEV